MWGTIILDAYRDVERGEVAAALDELCEPMSSYGFASGGIYYCYWDVETRITSGTRLRITSSRTSSLASLFSFARLHRRA